MNFWNLIGVGAWLLLLIFLVMIYLNIRHRHLKMIVNEGKTISGRTILIDLVEVVVFAALAYGMFYVTWLRPVNFTSADEVTLKYEYEPLVLQTGSEQSYYVIVQAASSSTPRRHYTYWSEGTKHEVLSPNADIADGTSPLPVSASAYPWSKKKLKKMDKQTDRAYTATVKATYEPNFLNGLGMHVGHSAKSYTIIRVPDEALINVRPVTR